MNENKWGEASPLLTEAMKDPATFQDAYISKIYLESYRGKENEITDFEKTFYKKADNPYPYIYALWFNEAVGGDYGAKRFEHQIGLLNHIVDDPNAPGTLVGSANYSLGLHHTFTNHFEKCSQYYDRVGNLKNWQFTGPFENLSQSGFYKNHGPLDHPEPNALFKSLTNADIKWFTPSYEIKEGWTVVDNQFNNYSAVIYAQNFVNSNSDQEVYCNAGCSGSLKVWINDELIIYEPEERVTEMDAYIAKCNLKKGVNRILIQLGFTNNSFSNFTIRFADEKQRLIPGITGSSVYSPYPKAPGNASSHPKSLLSFAEAYFTDKIEKAPNNLVNYLLLADVYLRNKKMIQARNLISTALTHAPNNCLLRMKIAEILSKEQNRTVLLEEIEQIKQLDPDCLLVMELNIKELFDNQKYEDGAKELAKRISLYGENEQTAAYKILLLVQEKKYDELVGEVERFYTKYPNNPKIVDLMYAVKKDVYKDNKAAMKIYETYMKNNFNYDAFIKYADYLSQQGNEEKALTIRKKMTELFPYSPKEFYSLSKYFYEAKQFDKAEEYAKQSLSLAPYNETYWEQLGDVKNEKKNITEALEAYNLSLKYNPNQYIILNKIRKLNGKSEAYKLLPAINIDSFVKADKINEAKNADYGYYYILDQKDVILYPDGGAEEYFTSVLRITNEKGVDKYKESSISYYGSQSLLIEKAEVIKKNNSRIDGEKNENEIVFTNLEAGDVVVYKYRLRNYDYGRLAKDFWDRFYFNGQIYNSLTRYTILVPSDRKIYFTPNNCNIQPAITEIENFKQYSWELKKPEPDKDEPLMPTLTDVSAVLHLSTIRDWKTIADWYSDISNTNAEEDFEIIALYKKLFPDEKKKLTQTQKARIIYDYIESNIRYSSVSFRQSAFVPQRPSRTLNTRLGDCKDLSSLFVTLARMASINAQMVLVDTRDNGEKKNIHPSVDFNHCIVKANLDNKDYYIELTDNDLPFLSLPNNLPGATILEIPYKNSLEKSDLKILVPANKTRDVVKRIVTIKPAGTDIDVSVTTGKYGNPTSSLRYTYKNLDYDKQLKEMEKTVAGSFRNIVKLKDLKFNGLADMSDSIYYEYNYQVKNEISEIGSLKTFRVTYPDVLASLDYFSADSRTYPIHYWLYEDIDSYETIVNISAPVGAKFIEVPPSENFSFKDMKYSIQYTLKAPDKMIITRKFSTNRQTIPANDYSQFKSFFEKIVRAEQKFIAFK
jgi:tetratricopeptide (TPR) repeat protein